MIKLFSITYFLKILGLTTLKHAKLICTRSYDKGYNDGRLSKDTTFLLTKKTCSYDVEKANTFIVPNSNFKITENIISRTRSEFSKKHPPTDEQSRLILSNKRNIRVIAGAGSGKSTTLIQRLVLLHKDLGIPLSEITVFSFTRASCADFRSKMIKAFSKHDIDISKDQAKEVVRTFHSKILDFSRQTIIDTRSKPFEFLKDNNQDIDDFSFEAFPTNLSNKQASLLKEHYDNCFKESADFQKTIKSLIIQMVKTDNSTDDQVKQARKYIDAIQDKDYEYSLNTHNSFQINCETPKEPIEFSFDDPKHRHRKFFCNRYIDSLDLYIIFAPAKAFLEDHLKNEKIGGIFYGQASVNKAALVNYFGSKKHVCIRNQEDINHLNTIIDYSIQIEDPLSNSAPNFEIQLSGDFKPSSILDAFYQTALFIESIGLEVEDIASAANYSRNLPLKDQLFSQALVQFWPGFSKHLNNNEIIRFHDLFKAFSDENNTNFEKIDKTSLKSMSNLLIDEFQDISSEAVSWIKGALYYLRRNQIDTSIACVGDDYQSIYGWRGASPFYLMDYSSYFPSKFIDNIQLNKNFRSHQSIVDAAEYALKDVVNKSDKKGKCISDLPNSCQINLVDSTEKEAISAILNKVNEFLDRYEELDGTEKSKNDSYLLVLSRSNIRLNDIRNSISKALGRKLSTRFIRFETFHRSKGLESEHCLLIDDCAYDSVNTLRNLFYDISDNFKESYDDSQSEESKRLAYVAMTRAMKSFYWIGSHKNGGTIQSVSEYLERNAH